MRLTRYIPAGATPGDGRRIEVGSFYRPAGTDQRRYTIKAMDCDPFGGWQSLKLHLLDETGAPHQVRIYILGGAEAHGVIETMSSPSPNTRTAFEAALETP